MSDEHATDYFVQHHEAKSQYDDTGHPVVTKTNIIRHEPWDKACKVCYPSE